MAVSSREAENHCRAARLFIEMLVGEESTSFDRTALRGMTVQTVTPGRIECRFHTADHTLNRYRTLHGGCIATLLDCVSTAVLLTLGQLPGVSVNLSINYLAAVPENKDVVVVATLVRGGRTLATLQADICSEDGTKLYARGTHLKFLPVHDPLLDRIKQEEDSKPDKGCPRSLL